MEIEKVLTVAAPVAKVWDMLLDPTVMASCVPGMKSIEVVDDDEYNALIQVKISFISARFKIKTRIVEKSAPNYLRAEGSGEDASVASSMKQQTAVFLAELPDGRTELRTKVTVDVVGRLGTFGLGVMKTKADRMWDEFSQNLATRLAGGDVPGASAVQVTYLKGGIEGDAAPVASSAPAKAAVRHAAALVSTPARGPAAEQAVASVNGVPASREALSDRGFWARLLGGGRVAQGGAIHVELHRGEVSLVVDWPVEGAAECAAWLRDALK